MAACAYVPFSIPISFEAAVYTRQQHVVTDIELSIIVQ